MSSPVFWNVDTQIDFVTPLGSLYVPSNEQTLKNLTLLTEFAKTRKLTVINTQDWHKLGCEEFKQYPEHCVEHSVGASFVPATMPENPHIFDPNQTRTNGELIDVANNCREIVIRKNVTNVFAESNIANDLLEILKPDHCIVYGYVSNICVDHVVQNLVSRNILVTIVWDATVFLTNGTEYDTLKSWLDHPNFIGCVKTQHLLG